MMRMKILGTKETFEFEPTEAHRKQAKDNHNQTLERLNERGGLSWHELAAVLECVPWNRINKKWTPDMFRKHCINIFGSNTGDK